MATRHGIRYPRKLRIIFDGGLNTKISPPNLLDNESADCLNIEITDGAIATRQGFSRYNTISVGTFTVDGLYTRRGNDRSETLVAFAGGHAFALGTTTFVTIPSAQSLWTAGVRVAGVNYANQVFFSNGNTPYKYNGSAWTRHGVPAPNSEPTAASAATGPLTGGYRYKITFVNSYSVESDANTATATLTAASATIGLTSLPLAPVSFGVNARYIYRTEAGGTSYKRVGTIADNTTTTFTDSVADSALGVAAPSDQGVPPNWNTAVCHQDRLFVNDTANPAWVWYSELGEPHVFKSTNFIFFGDDAGDTVVGLAVFNNTLVVACENSIWLVYMPSTDPTEWQRVKSKSSYGTLSPYGIISVNNAVMFPAVQNGKFCGFGMISGVEASSSVALSTVGVVGSELESQVIENEMFAIKEGTTLKNISGIVYKNKAYFTVPYGDTATNNNKMYVFDFSIENIVSDKKPGWIPWSGMYASQFAVYQGFLLFGASDATGYVHKLYNGTYADNGAAIKSYFYTKEFGGFQKDWEFTKDFRSVSTLVDLPGDWFMDVGYRTDSAVGGATTVQLALTPGGTLWGTGIWGTSLWGGGKSREDRRVTIAGAVGNRIQFYFSNQNKVNQYFKVHNIAFNYNVRGER
jgi:hypothetical protein